MPWEPDMNQRKPHVVKSRRPPQYNEPSESRYDEPSYMKQSMMDFMDDDQPGQACKAVKAKWNELGPLNIEDIMANSHDEIDEDLEFGQSRYSKYIVGQIGRDGRVQGVGKEIN